MAQIHLRRHPDGSVARQLFINGADFSNEVFSDDIELVQVGEGACAAVGLRVTLCVDRLGLEKEVDVEVTDHFDEVRDRVAQIIAADPEPASETVATAGEDD